MPSCSHVFTSTSSSACGNNNLHCPPLLLMNALLPRCYRTIMINAIAFIVHVSLFHVDATAMANEVSCCAMLRLGRPLAHPATLRNLFIHSASRHRRELLHQSTYSTIPSQLHTFVVCGVRRKRKAKRISGAALPFGYGKRHTRIVPQRPERRGCCEAVKAYGQLWIW